MRLVTGVVRSKWIASRFGLEGVGLLAQATQFQLLAVSASSLSVTAAVIQGAKGPYRHRSVELFRTALFLMLAGTGAITAAILAAGPGDVARWLFGEGYGRGDLFWIVASVPFILLSSAFTEAAFFVADRFDRYAMVSALHSMIQPIVFIAFTFLFGMKGILLAFPASVAILAILFFGDLARLGLLDFSWFRPQWNKEMAMFLAGHGIAMFATGVGGGFLLLFVRATLVSRMGLAENGVLQVPIALSAYGGAVVTNFIWGRVHPSCSKELGIREESDISFAVVSSFLVAAGTWAIAPIIIPFVYSKAFLPAVAVIGIQATGDIFYFSFFTLAVVLLAMGRIKTYVLGWVLYYSPYILALLLPGLQNVRAIIFLHFLSSAFAFFGLISIAAGWRLIPLPVLKRLSLISLFFGALVAAVAWANPESVLARLSLGFVIAALGLVVWRLTYGGIAKMPEIAKGKSIVRSVMRVTCLDRALASLLRGGVLPKSMERLAPQYRDYPAPSYRRVKRDGVFANLDLSDLPDWKAYFRLRDKKREKMYSMITPGASILDVGCAKGWVALQLARIVGRSGSLIAVDAHRPSVLETEKRLRANGFTWARATCIAFSDSEAQLGIAAEADRNSASVSVSLASGVEGTRATLLDSWLKEEGLKDPDILKIAINGWEFRALKGGLSYLRRRKPIIFIEIGDNNLRRAGSSAEEMMNLLDELGYRLEPLWGNDKIPKVGDLSGCLFDAVALPK